MPTGLVRHQTGGDLHLITFSCFRHRQVLGSAKARDTFLKILEETRANGQFHVLGFVAMPDHVHLLVSEPVECLLSTALQVVKQRFSRTRTDKEVWEARYHDFNVKTDDKRPEKLHYIHWNPVRRGLVNDPAEWAWSSFRSYTLGEPGIVTVSRPWDRAGERSSASTSDTLDAKRGTNWSAPSKTFTPPFR